jgi:hypothetical protein
VVACDDEGGGLCGLADETSRTSWEPTEALRRLQDEKGEDTMATITGNSNKLRG